MTGRENVNSMFDRSVCVPITFSTKGIERSFERLGIVELGGEGPAGLSKFSVWPSRGAWIDLLKLGVSAV